jgi:hypothetical protein
MSVAPKLSTRCALLLLVLLARTLAAQSQRDLYPIVVGSAPVYRGAIGRLGFIDGAGKIVIPEQFPAGRDNWEQTPRVPRRPGGVIDDNNMVEQTAIPIYPR